MRMKLIATLLTVIGMVLTLPLAQASTGDKRVALVIGNSAYQNAVKLPNPERDARAIADKLRTLGFVVVEGYDLTHDAFEDTIKDFSMAVRGADIGMFFYAGHGMQVNGRNYLVPVDAAFQDVSALDFEAISMDLVSKQMQLDVGVRLVILDACRDNPLSKTLSRSLSGSTRSTAVHEGLAEVKLGDAGEGTAIIFATSPDEVALDGEGEHSPFTTALLNNIEAPDTDLQVVMSRVTGEVYAATKQQQRPWINASLTGEVKLNPMKASTVAEAPVTNTQAAPASSSAKESLERETILYNLARDSGLLEDYQAYIEVFPNGLYAVNARKQLARLEKVAQEKDVAAVDPGAPAVQPPGTAVRSVDPNALVLPVTDVVKAMPADKTTENGLDLDRAKRVEVQLRLKLAGFDTGSRDGSFGRRSREAIQGWQNSRGLAATGFFNQPQLELLSLQTETQLTAYAPETPSVTEGVRSSKKKVRNATQRRSGGDRQRVVRRRGGSEDVGRFIGGVVRGALRF